ncbi:MAG: PstS family phosphate ABC transporter substrate-binding protein [Zhongshania sp.]|uniref:PstS family phosphate ABC transporter substrate-binding protein n=1 Tax=Zhongshania sp. TaxID=1971902 RepID=UPI0026053F72|nr:PstS family phosphate ABC transporter substrate-binding protein [Zhongshania sp.]MDF1693898.1 PstS family phosphate ABC transporter substrate-binding protein [Zhongshania sp.]
MKPAPMRPMVQYLTHSSALTRALAILVCASSLAACGNKPLSSAELSPQSIVADGSSTVFPLTKEAARRYTQKQNGADIRVHFSGTTAGFKIFCAGKSDISDASRPMTAEENASCNSNKISYIQIPVAMDTIALVVNPKNNWAKDISVAELKTLWRPAAEGKIKTWQDIRPGWPDQNIALFGRGKNSGTYDYFTQEIVGATRSSRSDYTASEDEEFLAKGIANDINAIGFFGIGAYHRHWDELKLLALKNNNGDVVYPSLDTVKNGSYTPLTRPLNVYVNKQSLVDKKDLRPFLKDYIQRLPSWIHFTGYIPLETAQYQQSQKMLDK